MILCTIRFAADWNYRLLPHYVILYYKYFAFRFTVRLLMKVSYRRLAIVFLRNLLRHQHALQMHEKARTQQAIKYKIRRARQCVEESRPQAESEMEKKNRE